MTRPTLEALLAESVPAARARESAAFDRAAAGGERPLVLLGAGHVGRKVLVALRRRGLAPAAIADQREDLRGTGIEGVPVLDPAEAARQFGREGVFVVTVFRGQGDGGMAAREELLRNLGCGRIVNFLPLAWKYPAELLPHFGADRPSALLEAAADLSAVNANWADAASREIFRLQLAWRLRADFSEMSEPAPDQYLPGDLFRLGADERFVDGGAFDGDTLRELGSRFARAWAIEPDRANAAKLREAADPRVTVWEVALGREAGEQSFSAGQGVASALNSTGAAKIRVETLDRLLESQSPTYLKLDVEGAEQAALEGGSRLIARARPIVAVCLYHRPDDLWRIPLFLRKHLPDHRLFLRAHQRDGFELVAYAVPAERVK